MCKEIVWIINGPNLNLIGKREVEHYGKTTFDHYLETLVNKYIEVTINYFQSNHEGAICDKLHEIGFQNVGIILNAGGLTHTSIALYDAIKAISAEVIEVHITNIWAREEFRAKSIIAPACKGSISGFGLKGYEMALDFMIYD